MQNFGTVRRLSRNPHNNVHCVQELEKQVLQHPMCLNLIWDGSIYTVVYPEGEDFYYSGILHRCREGKIQALCDILDRLEIDWKTSIGVMQ